jgi:hypothetical protein
MSRGGGYECDEYNPAITVHCTTWYMVLVTKSNSYFSIGRTYKRGYVAIAIFIRVLMHIVRPIPPGTYRYAQLI